MTKRLGSVDLCSGTQEGRPNYMRKLSHHISDFAREQSHVKSHPKHIWAKVKLEVDETQAGFHPGKGTHTQLHNLRLITERAPARRQPFYMCFVDFEKAFDTASHKKLWKTLEDIGFAHHMVKLIRLLYDNQKSNVRLGRTRSEWFTAFRGLRQGCNLSPYLSLIHI